MKTNLSLIIALIFTVQAYSQLEISLSGGLTTPNFEETKMFKPTFNSSFSVHYRMPINLMVGVNFQLPSKMKLYDTWAEPQLSYPYERVEYNTVEFSYNPIIALSLQYIIKGFNDKSAMYLGVNGGLYQSEVSGQIKFASDGYSETFDLTREEESDFGIAPKAGLRYDITDKILLIGELKYDIVLSAYKQHLFNANIGLAYIFK